MQLSIIIGDTQCALRFHKYVALLAANAIQTKELAAFLITFGCITLVFSVMEGEHEQVSE